MPFIRKRSVLILEQKDRMLLEGIAASRTESHGKVLRARMLLGYANGQAINAIASQLKISRPRVERCVDKALSGGVVTALVDLQRAGRTPKITEEDKAYVIDLACRKPTDLGYANQTWTFVLLAGHLRKNAERDGHPTLRKATKSCVHTILRTAEIKPHKLAYYLVRKDPEFEAKMAQVLFVYKVVAMTLAQEEQGVQGMTTRNHTVISYDEKPGIQALANIAPDLPPVPGRHQTSSRDYEYKRHGTVSLLAGIDLYDGSVKGLVRDRHRSREFIEFLGLLDDSYRANFKIRLVLDNHSDHISKETMQWLKKKPNRFEFVYTPTHGSWLNLIESFFSKMTRSFLRHIRVASKAELIQRIELYLKQVNEDPVIFRWTYKMDEVTL